jgi:hypothetical protein
MMNPIGNQSELERLKTTETQTETVLNLENDEKLSINLNEISNLIVYDEIGNLHKMSDVWAEFKTIFVFVRVCFLFNATIVKFCEFTFFSIFLELFVFYNERIR